MNRLILIIVYIKRNNGTVIREEFLKPMEALRFIERAIKEGGVLKSVSVLEE